MTLIEMGALVVRRHHVVLPVPDFLPVDSLHVVQNYLRLFSHEATGF